MLMLAYPKKAANDPAPNAVFSYTGTLPCLIPCSPRPVKPPAPLSCGKYPPCCNDLLVPCRKGKVNWIIAFYIKLFYLHPVFHSVLWEIPQFSVYWRIKYGAEGVLNFERGTLNIEL